MESSDNNTSANIDYVPIRILMWSLLNEEDRKTFKNATNTHPAELVTVSKFVERFWKLELKRKEKGELHAELAWYGIRTIIKGMYSKINPETKTEYTEEVSAEHFSQLMGDERAIPRRWTNDVFTNQQLRDLIDLYPLYERWRMNNGYYDELDIARVAIRTLRKIEFNKIDTKHILNDGVESWEIEKRVAKLPFGRDRYIFKKRAHKEVEKHKEGSEQRRNLQKWMDKHATNFPRKAVRVGKAIDGTVVYKDRLSQEHRVIFTPIKNGDKGGVEQIVIYDIVYEHDKQQQKIEHALETELGIIDEENGREEIDVEVFNTTPTKTPGRGPLRSVWNALKNGKIGKHDTWDILNMTSNIYADENQLRTIVGNNPILINGMAGSGKTAVLALRGAIMTAAAGEALPEEPFRILYSCYNPTVLSRLKDDTQTILDIQLSEITTPATKNRKDKLVTPGENDAKSWKHNELRYHEILIDEAQDLTRLELDILRKLTVDGDIRRIQMAGDPLQTLNPSGFNWKQIQVMISDFGGQKNTEVMNLPKNYRSNKEIVEIANAIQIKRNEATGEDFVIQEADAGYDQSPWIYTIKNKKDEEIIGNILQDSPKSSTTVLAWAMDDGEIIDLFEKDGILKNIIATVENTEDFRDQILIHSATSAKGLEFDTILLYKFASSLNFRTDLIALIQENIEVKSNEEIRVRFAFSRFYVSLTRAKKHIHIVEDEEGAKFWNQMKLGKYPGELHENYFEHKEVRQMETDADFDTNIEVSSKNFGNYLEAFKKDGQRSNIKSAILIASKMGDRKKQFEAEAVRDEEYANNETDLEKARILRMQSAGNYAHAGMHNKSASMYFQLEEYENCRNQMELIDSNNHWINLILLRCEENPDRTELLRLIKSKDFQEWKNCDLEFWKEVVPNSNLIDWAIRNIAEYLTESNNYTELIELIEFLGLNEVLRYLKSSNQFELILENMVFEKTGALPDPDGRNKQINQNRFDEYVKTSIIELNKVENDINIRIKLLKEWIRKCNGKVTKNSLNELREMIINEHDKKLQEIGNQTNHDLGSNPSDVGIKDRTGRWIHQTRPYVSHMLEIGKYKQDLEDEEAGWGSENLGYKSNIVNCWKLLNYAQHTNEIEEKNIARKNAILSLYSEEGIVGYDEDKSPWGPFSLRKNFADLIINVWENITYVNWTDDIIKSVIKAYEISEKYETSQMITKFHKAYRFTKGTPVNNNVKTEIRNFMFDNLKEQLDSSITKEDLNWLLIMAIDGKNTDIISKIIENEERKNDVDDVLLMNGRLIIIGNVIEIEGDEENSIDSKHREMAKEAAKILRKQGRVETAKMLEKRITQDPLEEFTRIVENAKDSHDLRIQIGSQLISEDIMPELELEYFMKTCDIVSRSEGIRIHDDQRIWDEFKKDELEKLFKSNINGKQLHLLLDLFPTLNVLMKSIRTLDENIESIISPITKHILQLIGQEQDVIRGIKGGDQQIRTLRRENSRKIEDLLDDITATNILEMMILFALEKATVNDVREHAKTLNVSSVTSKSKFDLVVEIMKEMEIDADSEHCKITLDVLFWNKRLSE